MKKTIKTMLWGAILLAATMMTGCGSDKEEMVEEIPPVPTTMQEDSTKNATDSIVVYMLPKTKTANLTAAQRDYVRRCNDFAFNLYRSVSVSRQGRSTIVAPLSLGMVLGMLHDGAQGRTASEILDVLCLYDVTKDEVNQLFATIISETPQIDTTVTCHLASMVAANKDISLSETFRSDMATFYHADIPQLDFSATGSCTRYINEWSAAHTGGLVSQLVSDGDLTPSMAMALLNAIYFKATWARKFDPAKTSSEAFATTEGQRSVRMMHEKAEILYAENDVFQMVSLPFGGGDKWSMKVLLPLDGKTVGNVVACLSTTTWADYTQSLGTCIVDLSLPRFSTRTNIEMNDILGSLGAPTMFTPQADFSLMTTDQRSLCVSLIRQMAATEVSEEGTEVAAVTTAMMVGADFPDFKNQTFHANRPFVYIIEEASTGAVFFIGTYNGD